MVHCCVPLCKNHSKRKNGVSFHEFPVDETLCGKWVIAVNRMDESGLELWRPSDRSAVCSDHFLSSDFRSHLKIRKLVIGAIPSVFECRLTCNVAETNGNAERPAEKNGSSSTEGEHPVVPELQGQEIGKAKPQSADSPNKRKQSSPTEREGDTVEQIISSASGAPCKEGESSSKEIISKPTDAIVKCDVSVLRSKEQSTSTESILCKPTMAKKVKDSSCLTNVTSAQMKRKQQDLKTLKQKYTRLCQKMALLQAELIEANGANKAIDKLKVYNIDVIEEDSANDNTKAEFIKEQLLAYKKKKPRFSEKIARYCCIWQSISPTAYRFVRKTKLLTLPSRATLERYLNNSCCKNVGEHVHIKEENADSTDGDVDSTEENVDSTEENVDSMEENVVVKEETVDIKEETMDVTEEDMDVSEGNISSLVEVVVKTYG